MKRREFIMLLGGMAAWPVAARAQQSVPVIGFLTTSSLDAPSGPIPAILLALRHAGFEVGQTVRMEYRYADNRLERLPALAAELVKTPCSVIVAAGGPRTATVLKEATSVIPIVFAPLPDPVRSGLVASLNRPGGNVTGVAALTIELDPKRIELLHELMPPTGAIGAMYNPTRPDTQTQLQSIQAATKAVGRELVPAPAATVAEIDAAFATLKDRAIAGLLIAADPFFSSQRTQIIELATRYRWPAIYQWREFADAGGLASYGANLADSYRQVGLFVARILRGEKPSELPVQQPTKFEFVINLRTAKSLGLEVPPTLLGGAAAAWPVPAGAQQPAMPVIAFLRSTTAAGSVHLVAAFRQGLNEAGFIEGQNVAIEYNWADDSLDRLSRLAADLVRRPVAVIVANGLAAAAATKAATATTPIVFVTGADPVRTGLVASLNRPGGNVTGVIFTTTDLAAKQLGLLHELVPNAAVIAALLNPDTPETKIALRDVEAAGRAIGRQILFVRAAGEFSAAFAKMVQAGVGALLVGGGQAYLSQRRQLVALATRHALPAVSVLREFVEAGGLMSYGSSSTDAYRQIGNYAGRILKGEKPAELPVQITTKFELVINLGTAKAIGLDVPPVLLARADEVLE